MNCQKYVEITISWDEFLTRQVLITCTIFRSTLSKSSLVIITFFEC